MHGLQASEIPAERVVGVHCFPYIERERGRAYSVCSRVYAYQDSISAVDTFRRRYRELEAELFVDGVKYHQQQPDSLRKTTTRRYDFIAFTASV